MSLTPEDVEQVANRVAELLAGEHDRLTARHTRLVDAAQVAEVLGVRRDWVYAHARELGAIRLGNGPRGRRRFDLDEIQQRLATTGTRTLAVPGHRPRRPRRDAYGASAVPPRIGKSPESGRATVRTSPARHRKA